MEEHLFWVQEAMSSSLIFPTELNVFILVLKVSLECCKGEVSERLRGQTVNLLALAIVGSNPTFFKIYLKYDEITIITYLDTL